MTKLQRLKEITAGLIMLVAALEMISDYNNGYRLIIVLLSVVLVIRGVRTLIFYFQMARFMVDGRTILYMSIILLDFGILTYSLTDVPHYYVLLYLILILAFTGLVEIMRANEVRRLGARSWKLKFTHGIINILMACICIVFMRHMKVAVLVYSLGLIYSGILRIISACRKSMFIYIQ